MLNVSRLFHYGIIASLAVVLSACKDAKLSFSNLSDSTTTTEKAITTSFSMSSPNAGSISNDFTPIVTGTYPTSGHSIYLYRDASCTTQIGTPALVSGTTFSVSGVTFSGAGADDGVRTIYYKAYDGAAFIGSCASTSLSYTLDTIAPAPATGLSFSSPASSPGSSLTPTFQVTGIDTVNSATITLHTDPSCTSVIYGTSSGTVTASMLVPVSLTLTEGTGYSFYAKAIDAAGNIACSAAFIGYTADVTPPTSTSISISGGATYINTTGVTLTLAATGASDMYITNTAGCSSGGAWESFTSTKAWTLGQTNSTATVYAKFKDFAGNVSACISDTIIHDSIAPTIAVSSAPAFVYTGNVSSYGAVSGTCSENGQLVYVKFNGSNVGSQNCSGGSFSIASLNAAAQSDGIMNITAETTDLAGNTTMSSLYAVTKDTVPPSVTISNPVISSYITAANAGSLLTSGLCSGGIGSVTIKVDGSTLTTISCIGSSYSISPDYTAISDGAHTITAEFSDAAGNTATSSSVSVTKDTLAPTLTASWTSSPTSPDDNTAPAFTNSLSETGYVRLYTSGDTSCVTPISNFGNSTGGTFTTTITTALSGEGYKNFRYKAVDSAGNSSSCNPVSFGSGYYLLTTPVLSSINNALFDANYLIAGTTYTANANNTVTGDDTFMSYTCTYDRVVSGSILSGSNCTSLPSLGYSAPTFNTSTGDLSWTVGTDAFGPYEIKIVGTRTGGSGLNATVYAVLDVNPGIYMSGLQGYYDAMFASTTGGSRDNVEAFRDRFMDLKSMNLTNYFTPVISMWGTYGWFGSLSNTQSIERSNPHQLSLGGSTDKLSFSTTYNSYSDFTVDFWFNRNAGIPLTGKNILGNANGTNGLAVFENPLGDGTIMTKLGASASYVESFAANVGSNLGFSAPLNEPSARPINVKTYSAGYINAAFTGNPIGGVTYGLMSPIRGGGNNAITFNGSTGYIDFGTAPVISSVSFSVCAWEKTTTTGVAQTIFASTNSGTVGSTGTIYLGVSSAGYAKFQPKNCTPVNSVSTVNDGAWHFVCGVLSGTTPSIYVDGSLSATGTTCSSFTNVANPVSIAADKNGGTAQNFFNGSIDEVFTSNAALSSGSIGQIYASRNIPHCVSKSHLYDSFWYYAAVIVNDTSDWMQLSFGEENQCSVGIQATDHYSGSASNLVYANDSSGSNGWTGRLGEIRMYNAANTSIPFTNYAVTAKKYESAPEKVGAIKAWYKNESLFDTANGTGIATWNDSSGNAYHLSQPTSVNRPTSIYNATNGKPMARFDGTNDSLAQATTPVVTNGSTSGTVFIVSKRANTGTTVLGTNGSKMLSYYIDGVGNHKAFWDVSASYLDAGISPSSVYYITTMKYDGTQGTNPARLRFYENGREITTGTYAGPVPASASTLAGYAIGSDYSGGNYLNGDIGEVIIFTTALTVSKQAQVEEYLSRKFGIPLNP